ncbi:flagellar hook-length control protein FliK [Cellulosilyticum sp. I15G10I2]|uniref:flagellar hook-length control protein FliK n=1 Tax=Cellulosilyticum sp. I15G10I2 TaxID=1892843 RepID=UPI00085C8BE3|nr:flagellar hook-length control protein FliK [Cellulosilyticum sp. I15G10I2]
MDNININLLAPSTQESKTDKISVKTTPNNAQESKNTFDNQLSRIKNKEVKLSKSVLKDAVKDIPINKPVEIKKMDEEANQEVVCQMILTLINNVLDIPLERIEQVLEDMNITPLDLINQDIFKTFLTQAYPSYDEHQLLFNEEGLKDVSKLFVKLEQIGEMIEGNQSHILIEKLVIQDHVVRTSIVQIDATAQAPEETAQDTTSSQVIIQTSLPKNLTGEPLLKEAITEELMPDGNLEDGIFNLQQTGLGMNIPIQSFNTAVGAKLWNTENTQAEHAQFVHSESITHQIINKLDITSLGNTKEISMELSPKELGNLSIKLVESNGVLVASIRVDNEKTKELLLNEVAQLKQTLESQGLSVSEVKVDIRQNPHHSQMEQQKQKSTRRIQELIDKHLIEEPSEQMQVDEKTGELIETEVNYMV